MCRPKVVGAILDKKVFCKFKNRRHSMKKILITLVMLNFAQAAVAQFSIGIPGVISVGGKGPLFKVGPGSTGTNIPTPNCGGSICGALENAKNELNGENKRKAAQADADQAAAELNAANANLNKIIQAVDQSKLQKRAQVESLSTYKAALIEGARQFHYHADVFEQDQREVQRLIALALKQVHDVRGSSKIVREHSHRAYEQLQDTIRAIEPNSQSERNMASVAAILVADKSNPSDRVKRAVENLKAAAQTAAQGVTQAASALSMINGVFGKEFVQQLVNTQKTLNEEMEASKKFVRSVHQIKTNVDNIAAEAAVAN